MTIAQQLREEGREQGRELGIKLGIKQGMAQITTKIASNLLSAGVDIELGVKATKLDTSEVQQLAVEAGVLVD